MAGHSSELLETSELIYVLVFNQVLIAILLICLGKQCQDSNPHDFQRNAKEFSICDAVKEIQNKTEKKMYTWVLLNESVKINL